MTNKLLIQIFMTESNRKSAYTLTNIFLISFSKNYFYFLRYF